MSITTKRGDDGHTDVMFGKRVPKNFPRVEAYGTVDELNSLLGVARHSGASEVVITIIDQVQPRLIAVNGELATLEEDMGKYVEKGYGRIQEEDVLWVESTAGHWEKECDLRFRGWAIPGREGNLASAQLDLARAVCRRAERRVVELRLQGELADSQIPLFLNRLSDMLWILARHEALTYAPCEPTRKKSGATSE